MITVGSIVAPHGVRGDLRILPQTDFPDRFLTMDVCYINGKEYHVTSARFHKQFILATFQEVADRNAAELLVKQEIKVRRDDLVDLPWKIRKEIRLVRCPTYCSPVPMMCT